MAKFRIISRYDEYTKKDMYRIQVKYHVLGNWEYYNEVIFDSMEAAKKNYYNFIKSYYNPEVVVWPAKDPYQEEKNEIVICVVSIAALILMIMFIFYSATK